MSQRVLAVTAAALLCFAAADTPAQDPTVDEDLDRAKRSLALTIAGNMTNVETYDTNGFRLEASDNAELGADLRPNGNRFQLLSVSAPGAFRAVVEKGRPSSQGGGTALLHRDSGEPMLSASDADGDGLLEGVTYSKMDENGKTLLTVIDYEVDGQADLRIHFADGFTEVWHVDRWYRIERRDGRRGITLNGAFVELEQRNNRLVVPDR
jgi:hypothetical protein